MIWYVIRDTGVFNDIDVARLSRTCKQLASITHSYKVREAHQSDTVHRRAVHREESCSVDYAAWMMIISFTFLAMLLSNKPSVNSLSIITTINH